MKKAFLYMNTVKILAVLAFAASLFGCVDTPENLVKQTTPSVIHETETSGKISDVMSDEHVEEAIVQVERGSLEEIRSQLDLDLQKTYKNITITYARTSEADTMPTYDIEIGMKPDFTLDSLLKRMYGDTLDISDKKYYLYRKIGEAIDKAYPALTEPKYRDDGKNIMSRNVYDMDITIFSPDYNKDVTLSTIAYSNGNIFGSQCGGGLEHGNDWYSYADREICKQYYLMNEQPSPDESYVMVDGEEWNTLEAIEFVETFWKDYITPSDTYNFTYSVKALYVVKIDDSHFAYLFEMQRQDEAGNYYDVDKTDFYFSNNEILDGIPFPYTNRLVTYCAEKESISRFGKDFSFTLTDKTDNGDDLLALGAAAELLSEALAPNLKLHLTAELNYMVVCKGYHCADSWIKKDFYNDLFLRESDFEIRPYWCFKPVGQCFLMNEIMAERYYVDAVTGEVSTITRGTYQKYEQSTDVR